jgi:hypothetical protein
MPNGNFFQTTYPFPSQAQPAQSTQPNPETEQMDNKPTTNDASSALAEAIDDFLGDLERKFKTVSDEILTKRESICPLDISGILFETADDRGGHNSGLEANVTVVDDMGERCDRIEAELLMRDAAGTGGSKSSLEEKSEG